MKEKEFKRSLFVFRRDLRVDDNLGLQELVRRSESVLTCFIFDPRQLEENTLFNSHCVQFMIESLEDLRESLRSIGGHLSFLKGVAEDVIDRVVVEHEIEAVAVGRDYTPFSIARDKKISEKVQKRGAAFISASDVLLHEVGTVLTGSETPYKVFTPFYRRAKQLEVATPTKTIVTQFDGRPIAGDEPDLPERVLPRSRRSSTLFVGGGRRNALSILRNVSAFKEYHNLRDFPALEGTTGLSAHHKFGTVSIREVFHCLSGSLGADHSLVRQLYWRDFFSHVAHHFPHVFKGCFKKEYDALEWEDNEEWFERWSTGTTGFPIVDAGMRQLNQTGFMHNRVRMIVASFLVKDLILDWRRGEQYFAMQLLDYDWCVNNGSWQWAASTGVDAQPYFRIFNPWLQQKKFDQDATYIKRWIPELQDIAKSRIHSWDQEGELTGGAYPRPIVRHAAQKERALAMFELVREAGKAA